MQQVQRGMVPGQIQTPLMQHPHVPHGDPTMSAAPRTVMYSNAPIQDASAMMDQQARLIQQREGKAAAQRALGVASNGPSVQHHPGLHQVRPIVIPTGQTIFIDSHGRPVQPPPGMVWQGVQQRGPPAGLIQVQEQAHYQQHPAHQPQMMQAHYAHQLAHQQQQAVAARNQSQPPSVRPPTSVSPAMLHVPPTLQRSNSQTGSMRSITPQPLHMHSGQWTAEVQQSPQRGVNENRPQILPSPGHQMQGSSCTTQPSQAVQIGDNGAGGGQVEAPDHANSHNMKRKATEAANVGREKRRMDAMDRMRRHVELAQSHLADKSAEMEKAKATTEAKVEEWKKDSDAERKRFEKLVLEYLEKAGYTETSNSLKTESRLASPALVVSRVPDGEKEEDDGSTSSEDTTLFSEKMDILVEVRTSDSELPNASSGQRPRTASSQTLDSSDSEEDAQLLQKKATPTRHSSFEKTSPQSSDIDMAGEGMEDKDLVEKENQGRTEELGYLYHWWRIFRDTQHLTQLGVFNPTRLVSRESTAKEVTAKDINVKEDASSAAAPATAQEINTPNKPKNATSNQAEPTLPITPVAKATDTQIAPISATAQQDEIMRRIQDAQTNLHSQISAEASVSGMSGISQPPPQPLMMVRRPSEVVAHDVPKAVVQLPDGRNVLMSRAEVERYSAQTQQMLHQNLIEDAQRRGIPTYSGPVVLQHPQPMPANGTIHPMEARLFTPVQNQYSAAMEERGSPADGGALKRHGPSPDDGPSKRAKTAGNRPTPEDHQRQAADAAARALAMSAPQLLQNQKSIPQPIARSGSVSQSSRHLTEQQRLYAQRQSEYARQQVANSPLINLGMSPSGVSAALPHPPPMGSPSTMRHYEVGTNGLMDHAANPNGQEPTPPTSGKGRLKKTPSLSLDLDGDPVGDAPPTTGSVKKRGAGAKRGGKAPGSARGGKKVSRRDAVQARPAEVQGAKGRQSVDTSTDSDMSGLFAYSEQTPLNISEDLLPPPNSAPGSSRLPMYTLPASHFSQDPSSQPQEGAGRLWFNHQSTTQGQQTAPPKHESSGGAVPTSHGRQEGGNEPASADHILSQFDGNPFGGGAFAIDDEFFKSLGSFAETEGMTFAQAAGDGAPSAALDVPPLSASASLNFDFSEGAFGDFDFTNFASQGNENDTWS